MTDTVEVLDRCMGSGKTTQCFKWMERHKNTKFLYVSPLLSEVEERIVDDLPSLEFISPSLVETTKSDHLLSLLKQGQNISFTHSLFSVMTREHMAEIHKQGYTVIIDEEMGLIEPMPSDYKTADVKFLLANGFITIDESAQGKVCWLENDETTAYDSKYGKFKAMCDIGMLYSAKRKGSEDDVNQFFVTQLPTDLLTCANRVIVLTYLFNGSIMDCFLRLKGLDVIPFTEYDVPDIHPSTFKPLINFVGNTIRKKHRGLSLSGTGWSKRLTAKDYSDIAKAITSIGKATQADMHTLCYAVPKEAITPSSSKGRLVKPRSFPAIVDSSKHEPILDENDKPYASGCWLYSEARATNLYRNRTTMIYCVDKYPQLAVSAYLQDYGYEINNDGYALSCLLQWLFRGCIRTGKPMNVCCISTKDRMHNLLCDWLDGKHADKQLSVSR